MKKMLCNIQICYIMGNSQVTEKAVYFIFVLFYKFNAKIVRRLLHFTLECKMQITIDCNDLQI